MYVTWYFFKIFLRAYSLLVFKHRTKLKKQWFTLLLWYWVWGKKNAKIQLSTRHWSYTFFIIISSTVFSSKAFKTEVKSIEILDRPNSDISNEYSNDYSIKSGKQIVLNHENTAVLFRRAPLFSRVRAPFEEMIFKIFPRIWK